jgi:hypothetical protein
MVDEMGPELLSANDLANFCLLYLCICSEVQQAMTQSCYASAAEAAVVQSVDLRNATRMVQQGRISA